MAVACTVLTTSLAAQESTGAYDWPQPGDTGVSSLGDWDFEFGIQYRLMGNASNLPGPGGTGFGDTRSYDFLRQRLRLNLDITPTDSDAGAYLQFEFRGGSGGSGPGVTDPREADPSLNPFNFVDARGLRFGYLWWEPSQRSRFEGGVIPVSDQFGDTLFSADWDWSVGGFQYRRRTDSGDFRFAALHLVEGVGSVAPAGIGDDGWMAALDLNFDRDRHGLAWGLHAYGFAVEEGLPLGGTEQLWLGPTVDYEGEGWALSGMGIYNLGRLGTGELDGSGQVVSGFGGDDSESHSGYALGVEFQTRRAGLNWKAQALHSSGDRGGQFDSRFVTPQALFGTKGYWGYTHIFTANGPSDVNDLGVEIGGGGAGLWTLQAQIDVPLTEPSSLHFTAGSFSSDASRNGSHRLGHELGCAWRRQLSSRFVLDTGLAYADVGPFFGDDPDDLWEVFVRLQLQ